ncbi:dol-P-Man:Man(6)GlcNAc(2)-PP-Dol alpha-1,2-mannosyltransferase-like [Olea europaea var. sylvestris]|uniref:dol-P-Man:Man(6)GlcNAc(2)-PP-Dol alpha-1,2-mannosyltransferase-like n=1 Tax=Olea europaea var. sylvestris TaxID=158386 RepID=UPI000C1D3BE6|nr:dol-P-Man:Man(6)GlcNAc(2)-PP-Dol alpha-1,2-mannosyltransferase-like [Olea europaea var. sylvestris]
MSATSNIVHDCDEVFNYWEPLHLLLYKSGFQTWENSSQFALRSYLYILLHELAGGPASWWFHDEKVGYFCRNPELLFADSGFSLFSLFIS